MVCVPAIRHGLHLHGRCDRSVRRTSARAVAAGTSRRARDIAGTFKINIGSARNVMTRIGTGVMLSPLRRYGTAQLAAGEATYRDLACASVHAFAQPHLAQGSHHHARVIRRGSIRPDDLRQQVLRSRWDWRRGGPLLLGGSHGDPAVGASPVLQIRENLICVRRSMRSTQSDCQPVGHGLQPPVRTVPIGLSFHSEHLKMFYTYRT